MAVHMTCECGTSYDLKDEFAGKLVKCPQCGRPARAPTARSAAVVTAEGDPAFDRDIFLLRQQLLKISEKYDVGDEQGNKIIFVERPAHLLRNLGAILVVLAGLLVGLPAFAALIDAMPPGALRTIVGIIGML